MRSDLLLPDGVKSAKRTMELSFLLSPRVMTLIHVFGCTLSVCVFDLECINATLRRIHTMGRCPNFSTKAVKVYFMELRVAFESAFGTSLPDALEELQAHVLSEINEAKQASGEQARARERRGIDQFMKYGTNDLKVNTALSASNGTNTVCRLPSSRVDMSSKRRATAGSSNLVNGMQNQRTHSLMDVWRDSGWATKEMWKQDVLQERAARDAVAEARKHQQTVVTLSNIVNLSRPSWQPHQFNLSGTDRHILSEIEYKAVLRNRSCDELEQAWVNDFDKSIGLKTELDSISGPQVESQAEIDSGVSEDFPRDESD